jgi:Ca2+:H+ antiporter
MIGNTRMPCWTWASPLLALLLLTLATADIVTPNAIFATFAGIALIATVFAAVFHAEIIAHRVGEPFGTLVLAVAVTVIEVSLIVFVMLGGGPDKAALARDTVFAVVMIVCNGIVGMCLLSGGVRHHEQGFQVQGASAALAVLAALTTLTLVVPNTTSTAGPFF